MIYAQGLSARDLSHPRPQSFLKHLKQSVAPWALVSLLALSAQAVAAQEASKSPEADEIYVVAQKTPHRLLTTPVSLSYIDGQSLRAAEAYDLKAAQILTPSLLITSTANEAQTTARLRGVGTVGDNPGLESSVGVVIDGVVRARTATAMSDLGELDHIEILKGPQTSLFGKGASAGLIVVETKAPSEVASARYELSLGEHQTRALSAYLTGPLSADVAGSLSVVSRQAEGQYGIHKGDGPRQETRDNDQNYYSLRAQTLWSPYQGASLRLIADYSHRDENCCSGVMISRGATSAAWVDQLSLDQGVSPSVNPKGRQAWLNRSTRQLITDMGLSLKTELDLNADLHLTSITAWRSYDHSSGYDADFTSADIYYRNPKGEFGNRFDTLSQELRLSGRFDKAQWLLGLYADREHLERHDEYLYGADYEPYMGLLLSSGADINRVSTLTGLPIGASFVAGRGARDLYNQNDRNLAIFGQLDYALSPELNLVVGLRQTVQNKSLISAYNNTDNGAACAAAQALGSSGLGVLCLPWSNKAFNQVTLGQKLSDQVTTGTLKLVYRLSDKAMTYLSFNQGQKGAGFNLDREQLSNFALDSDTRFAPETVRAYEWGYKARLGQARLSLAAFHQAFSHFQLNSFLGTTFLVKSIPHLNAQGVELEARLPLSADLVLNSGLTFTDTQFGREAVAGLPLIAGSTASFAPKWSVSAQLSYKHRYDHFDFSANLDGRYNSQYNTGSDLNPIKLQRAYSLFNGRLSFAKPDGRLALDLWGTNLTDQTYYQVAFSSPFQSGTFNAFLGRPRTLGLTLRLKP